MWGYIPDIVYLLRRQRIFRQSGRALMRKALVEGMHPGQVFLGERHAAGLVEDKSLPNRVFPSRFLSTGDWLQGQ